MALTIILSAFTISKVFNWKIADGYAVNFVGKDVDGSFSKMTGEISFDEKDLASSKFMISIDVSSIATGNGMKNRHAKSDKWFDAKQFPSINFTSSKISKSSQGYLVEGMLDMHGIKKAISFPFTFSNNIFNGSFSVNRMDYGVGSMQGMSKKVSDEIKIAISVPVIKI